MWTTSDNRKRVCETLLAKTTPRCEVIFLIDFSHEPNRDVKHRASTSKCYNCSATLVTTDGDRGHQISRYRF